MPPLSVLCRNLRQPLEGGLSWPQTARLLARHRRWRRLGELLLERLAQGERPADVLAAYRPTLPTLFLAMTSMGEETGRLPETLRALEDYYRLQEQLRGQVIGQAIKIGFQLVAAVLVLAATIGIVSSLAPQLGFGVLGQKGITASLLFIGIVAALGGGLFVLGMLLARAVGRVPRLARLLRRLPGVGPFWEAMLLWRFSIAMRLTLDSHMAIGRALQLSFRAADDAGFAATAEIAIRAVKAGEDLSTALARTEIFPADFLEAVAISETVGSVPERLVHLAEGYYQLALERAKVLASILMFGMWLFYAALVVYAILKLAGVYLAALS